MKHNNIKKMKLPRPYGRDIFSQASSGAESLRSETLRLHPQAYAWDISRSGINLGSGNDYREGYLNIDIRPDVGADLVHDITKKFPLPDNSISEIIAQDVFEHLIIEDQERLFEELHRLLDSGGHLKIRIPNNDDIWERFGDDQDTRNLFLFGDTSESGVWGAHKSGHTRESFVKMAALSGFGLLNYSPVDTNYEFEFIKKEKPKLKGVVFINQSLGMGGAEKFSSELLSQFTKNKISVSSWTTQGINSNKIPFVVDVIGDWKGLIKGLLLFPFAFIYYGFLTYKNRNNGTILMTGFIEKIMVSPWAKIMNIPLVWVEYGPLDIIFSKFSGLPKLLYRLVCKLPDFVIMPSKNTKIKNTNISGISTAKTKVIPCGITPLTLFKKDIDLYSAFCVSRMEEGKGQDILIKSWPKVIRKFPKAKLYLLGEGDFKLHLMQLVVELKLQNSVQFLGRVPDLAKTVAPFNLSICPSVWPLEGFGLVLLEAMSLKRPIVCFNAGPYPEIVNNECAILVEKNNIDELSNAIIQVFSNPNLVKKLGENGKNRFDQLYSIEKVYKQYYDILLKAQVA